MTPEFIATSLFRPFSSTKNKGLGIGMFQCKVLVEAHGGTIEIESTPGVGTCIGIHLPALVSAKTSTGLRS
jgi:signal transduction histidine kinase